MRHVRCRRTLKLGGCVAPSLVGCLVLLAVSLATAVGQDPAAPSNDQKVVHRIERVLMQDGIRLHTEVLLPEGDGPFPVIVVRNPYAAVGGERDSAGFAREFTSGGYACVIQDCRGTGDSEGAWAPGIHDRRDGLDLRRWVLAQSWCDGNLATYGGSYLGFTQWAVAPDPDESFKAMCTVVPLIDWYEYVYRGGALYMDSALTWSTFMCRPGSHQTRPAGLEPAQLPNWRWRDAYRHLPLNNWDEEVGVRMPWLRDWVAHPVYDAYWSQYRITDQLQQATAANLTITGWYDLFLGQALRHVPALREHAATPRARHQHLVIGPWGHSADDPIGEIDFGEIAKIDEAALHRQWFDHWLKGADGGVDQWPFLRIFVMGANQWRDENEWPLARTQFRPYYFHSDGTANTLDGDGRLSDQQPAVEPSDHYIYNPADPVPMHGGDWSFYAPCGPLDQRAIESRQDVLVYTSEELKAPLEVTGPVKVSLYAASSASDTDWTAKLVDVHPDGRAFNLCDGIIRARYRESPIHAQLLTPGEICRYEIDLQATSNVFLAGHRLRVEISSSNFPRFDRNPNTGHAFGVDAELQPANQTVYHDKEHPSHILLPVIPQ